MVKFLLPLLFLAIGTGAGIGAALLTAPGAAMQDKPVQDGAPGHSGAAANPVPKPGGEEPAQQAGFVAFDHQFVVPLVQGDRVSAIVVLSLSLEAEQNIREAIYAHQPKLRDLLLRVLFDHANMGGFEGAFTRSGNLDLLRTALREAVQKEMGPGIHDVLIVDIARQDS